MPSIFASLFLIRITTLSEDSRRYGERRDNENRGFEDQIESG